MVYTVDMMSIKTPVTGLVIQSVSYKSVVMKLMQERRSCKNATAKNRITRIVPCNMAF